MPGGSSFPPIPTKPCDGSLISFPLVGLLEGVRKMANNSDKSRQPESNRHLTEGLRGFRLPMFSVYTMSRCIGLCFKPYGVKCYIMCVISYYVCDIKQNLSFQTALLGLLTISFILHHLPFSMLHLAFKHLPYI